LAAGCLVLGGLVGYALHPVERGIDVRGTLVVVDDHQAAGAFVPTNHKELLDGDISVPAILANRTEGKLRSGQEFTGIWLDDEQILIVTGS